MLCLALNIGHCSDDNGTDIFIYKIRMIEYEDKFDEELASAFITTTCQLLIPGSALVYSEHMHNLLASNYPEPKEYVIPCGSNVEFYIRPLLTCVDDADRLIAYTDELVFSGEFPVLPSDVSGLVDLIKCYKIEPYDRYPGFARLKFWGEMNYNWKYKKYEFHYAADTNNYAMVDLDSASNSYFVTTLNSMNLLKTISGPAARQQSADHPRFFIGIDFVRCVWCPQWPKEARGWLNRPRLNGWPTNDIISEVVQSGCHVVCANHRSCRDDKLQWRFSFSLAEVILLQSWTPKQQIVYHLLRFFAKRELIQKNCRKEDEVLCPYHLKTIMLWTCEDMLPEWWNFSSVISICCELLQRLSEWLKRRFFPNYFIAEANLFKDQASSIILEKTVRQLNKFRNSRILCHWFVENYILFFILRHFKPMEEMPHFVDYMLLLVELWNVNRPKSLGFYFMKSFAVSHGNCRYTVKLGLNSGLRQCLMRQNMCRSIEFVEHMLPTNLKLNI